MARVPLNFKERDLRVALRAALEAGLTIAEITVSHDGIKILTGPEPHAKSKIKNPWDKYYENPPKLRKGV